MYQIAETPFFIKPTRNGFEVLREHHGTSKKGEPIIKHKFLWHLDSLESVSKSLPSLLLERAYSLLEQPKELHHLAADYRTASEVVRKELAKI